MKKLIFTWAIILATLGSPAFAADCCPGPVFNSASFTFQEEAMASTKHPFCSHHPKICRTWRRFKHFCKETLVPVQWTASVLTILLLI